MSKTTLLDALKTFDLPTVRTLLQRDPTLRDVRAGKDLNLLQFCSSRCTAGDRAAAARQVRLAEWLVDSGFDPRVIHRTAPGDDGEDHPAELSLVWFAIAKARNNRLARLFLAHGAKADAMFAAAWWANVEILEDLVAHGDDINREVGATPLHMAVDLLNRPVPGSATSAAQRLACVKEFLRLGADPNRAAHDGTTPLHIVLRKDLGVPILKLLLRHGANPDLAGDDGRTVREIAARKRDQRYLQALAATHVRSRPRRTSAHGA
jgi:hypothetical protein